MSKFDLNFNNNNNNNNIKTKEKRLIKLSIIKQFFLFFKLVFI